MHGRARAPVQGLAGGTPMFRPMFLAATVPMCSKVPCMDERALRDMSARSRGHQHGSLRIIIFRISCAMCSKGLSMDERALWDGRVRAPDGRARAHERALWVEGLRGHTDVWPCKVACFASTVPLCSKGLCMHERALRDMSMSARSRGHTDVSPCRTRCFASTVPCAAKF